MRELKKELRSKINALQEGRVYYTKIDEYIERINKIIYLLKIQYNAKAYVKKYEIIISGFIK